MSSASELSYLSPRASWLQMQNTGTEKRRRDGGHERGGGEGGSGKENEQSLMTVKELVGLLEAPLAAGGVCVCVLVTTCQTVIVPQHSDSRHTQTQQQSLTENEPVFTAEISVSHRALRSIFTQYSIQ